MAELTHEELKAEHERVKTRLADVMAEGGSYRNLQVQLDAALQKHKDDQAAFDVSLKSLADQHAAQVAEMLAAHGEKIESMKAERDKALADQVQLLSEKHAAEIARLKAEVLVPALKDMQARQAADLAAKHAAELAKLQ